MAAVSINSQVYLVKTTDEQNRPNVMIQSIQTPLDRDLYPIVLNASERQQMNYELVSSVLREKILPPSAMIGLAERELTPTLRRIDDAFRVAMQGYRDDLIIAVGQDLRVINPENQKLQKILDNTNYTKKYTLIGSSFLLVGTISVGLPFFLLGAVPVCLAGLAGNERDHVKKKMNATETINTLSNQSASRRYWLISVDQSERKRLKDMKNILTTRMETLKSSLDGMGKGEYDIAFIQEFRQLINVYQAVFPPGQDLKIQGVDPTAYLNQVTSS